MALPPRIQELSALLRHDDKAHIDQGIELALALDDPTLLAALFKGTVIRADGDLYRATGVPEVTLPPALKPKHKHFDQGVRYAFYALLGRSTAPALVRLREQVVGLDWGYTPFPIELERFTALASLSLSPQQAPTDLAPLRALPRLKRLTLSGTFTSLGALRSDSLEDLRLYGLHGALYAPDALPSLRCAAIESVSTLTDLSAMRGHPRLTVLRATNCKNLTSAEGVQALSHLEHLNLGFSGVASLDALRGHPSLKTLDVTTTPVRDLSALEAIPTLTQVLLDHTGVTTLAPLASLAGLAFVGVSDCSELESLDGLPPGLGARWPAAMRSLRWNAMHALRSLAGAGDLFEAQTEVALYGLRSLTALTGLVSSALGRLTLEGAAALASLRGINGCPNLTDLAVHGAALSDVAPLAPLTALRRVDLSGCAALTDVSALAALPALEVLDLRGCAGVRDVSSLAAHPTLRTVALHGTSVAKKSLPAGLAARCVFVERPPPDRMTIA